MNLSILLLISYLKDIPFEEFLESNLESTIEDIRRSLNNLKSEKKSSM